MNKVIVTLCLLATIVAGQVKAQTTRPVVTELAAARQIISRLDDPDPDIRRAASLKLNSLGAGALDAIESALKDENVGAESVARLQAALKFVRPRAMRLATNRARLDWESRTFHDAYVKGGNTDPKSDSFAQAAITLFLQLTADPLHGPAEPRQRALDLFKTAVDAGCGDPMIHAMYCITNGKITGAHMGPVDEGLYAAVGSCIKGNYPPIVKLRVLAGYLVIDNSARDFYTDSAVRLMTEIAQSKDVPTQELDLISDIVYAAARASHDLDGRWDAYLKAYEKTAPGRPGPIIDRARYILEDQFETRVYHVNIGDWGGDREKAYDKEMDEAADLLKKGWEMDPTDSWACRNMIHLMTVRAKADRGKEDRDAMELWFDRAMTANPDDRNACNYKLQYLSPDWHGDFDQMIAFGRDCLKTENWRGGIPMVLVGVHDTVADASNDRAEYFAKPEVWNDIREVYEGAILNFPTDLQRYCEFARYAALCGHWEVVDVMCRKIGDKPLISVFGSMSSYNYLRKKAARLAGEKRPGGVN